MRNNEDKNVLITGGAGFIGSNLALRLIDMNYDVTLIDNLSAQVHTSNYENSYSYNLIKNKAKLIVADITASNVLTEALVGKNIIVHLAAETGTGQSMYEIEKYTNTNVLGTAILLDALVNTKHNVNKFVVASSRAIYGEGKYECHYCGIVYPTNRTDANMSSGIFNPQCPICFDNNINYLPTDEDSLQNPESIYAINKQTQEKMALTIGRMLGLSTTALRFQNVYGPGQSLNNPYTGILSIFSNLLRKNEPVYIFEDGEESRDFVYIDDAIDAIIQSIESPLGLSNTFNVGSGVSTSVIKVANELKRCYLSESEITITGRYRLGDIRHNIADLNSIMKNIGYQPKTDFITGLNKFSQWVLNNEPSSSLEYQKSIQELEHRGLYK